MMRDHAPLSLEEAHSAFVLLYWFFLFPLFATIPAEECEKGKVRDA